MQSCDVGYVNDSPTRCHVEGVCRRLKVVNRRRTGDHEVVEGLWLCDACVERRSSEDRYVLRVLLGHLWTPRCLLAHGRHVTEVLGNVQVQIHLQEYINPLVVKLFLRLAERTFNT